MAACVTVTVWPATVSVPVRGLVAVFAATLNVTVAMPAPVAPAVTVIQLSLLTATQVQLEPVVTERLFVVAVEITEKVVCDTL